MMRSGTAKLIVLVAWASILALAVDVVADYKIVWQSIDGGGGQSSGAQYVLNATIGQPDADWCSGGDFEMLGGFRPGGPLCFVEFSDFARFADLWLVDDLTADVDGDEDVDFADLQSLTDYWLSYCPYAWPLD